MDGKEKNAAAAADATSHSHSSNAISINKFLSSYRHNILLNILPALEVKF